MRYRQTIFAAAAIACILAGLAFGLLIKESGEAHAQASQSAREVGSSPKWEYCAITGINLTFSSGKVVGTAWIRYFRRGGSELSSVTAGVNQTLDVPKDEAALRGWISSVNEQEGLNLSVVPYGESARQELQEQARREALVKAIARLGEERWEMVGSESGDKEILGATPRLNVNQTSGSVDTPVTIYFRRPAP